METRQIDQIQCSSSPHLPPLNQDSHNLNFPLNHHHHHHHHHHHPRHHHHEQASNPSILKKPSFPFPLTTLLIVSILWILHFLIDDQPFLLVHELATALNQPNPLYRASWTASSSAGTSGDLLEIDHELIEPSQSNLTKPPWTFVLIHGLGAEHGSDSFGLRTALLAARPDLFGPMRFLIPFAHTLPISVFGGTPRPAWFDIASWEDVHEREDEEHMRASVRGLSELIRRYELQLGRTIIGGFSQGAVMSLLLGLTLEPPPAGLIMLSGYTPLPNQLPRLLPLRPSAHPTILHWLHGKADPFFRPEVARAGFEYLKSLHPPFASLRFEAFDKIDHRWEPHELEHAIATIDQVVGSSSVGQS